MGAPIHQNCPFKWGDLDPCNTWCLGPMRAHNPNGTSIGSAVFAQMTAECANTLQRFACFPVKIALYHIGIWSSCNTWFIGFTRVLNPNDNMIVSAVFAVLTSVTDLQSDRQTDRPRYSVRCGIVMRNYGGYVKTTHSFHVSTNNFATTKSLVEWEGRYCNLNPHISNFDTLGTRYFWNSITDPSLNSPARA